MSSSPCSRTTSPSPPICARWSTPVSTWSIRAARGGRCRSTSGHGRRYDRFRTDGVWADAAAQLTRRVRKAHGRSTKPATGIMDSQSVVSGPQQGERGFDGNKKIKGVKRHVLTCSLGFVLAILVTAANIHDTKAAEFLLDRAAENGFRLDRVKVDGIYTGSKRFPVGTRSSSRFPHVNRSPGALPRYRCAGASTSAR